VNGIFLLALRQTRISDTRSERRRVVWTTCKSCLTQCNWGLIRRRACFWPSSGLVCQSPISLSQYALELLISMEYRHILMASIAELSVSVSREAKIGTALNRISGETSDNLYGRRFPTRAAARRLDETRIRMCTLPPQSDTDGEVGSFLAPVRYKASAPAPALHRHKQVRLCPH
jgi:hypothetical protein